MLTTLMLEKAGFRVTTAQTGFECIEKATSGEHFDLYLLDNAFQDASGVDLCRQLREINKDAPILFFSGRALPHEKEAALKAGAQAYLVKPSDLSNVVDHATKLIEESKK